MVENDKSGVLVDDPADHRRFADAVTRLLNDPERACEMGRAARLRIAEGYLADRELISYGELLSRLAA